MSMPARNEVAIAFDHTEAFSTARRSARIWGLGNESAISKTLFSSGRMPFWD